MSQSVFSANDLYSDLKSRKEQNISRQGVSTGFTTLDEFMTIDKGYLSIISGLPSSGKSEMLDAILDNCAILHGWKTLIFSPENFPLSLHLRKHVERYIGKNLYSMSNEELDSGVEFANKHFMWMYPEEDYSLDGILKIASKTYEQFPFDCIVIDPWNEVDHSSMGGSREDQYISKCLTKIRRFNREYKTHSFVVAHPVNPSKTEKDANGNYKMPTLNEIAGGATWRAKADYGWVAHRHPMENVCKISVQKIKQKDMGMVGSTSFDYDRATGRFKAIHERDYIMPHECEPAF